MTLAAFRSRHRDLIAMDMTEGIIDRFRTMAISRPSVLTGHVVGADPGDAQRGARHRRRPVVGFRPDRRRLLDLGSRRRMLPFALALWPATALRLRRARASRGREQRAHVLTCCRSSAVASCRPTPCQASASSPSTSRSRPSPRPCEVCCIGTTIGTNAIVAVAWSIGIAAASYLWALRLYTKRSA